MLVRGKGGFGRNEEATGIPARLSGLLLMLPLPIGFLTALALGEAWGPQAEGDATSTVLFVDMISIFVCCTLALLITLNASRAQKGA
jgi:hypothetical protein